MIKIEMQNSNECICESLDPEKMFDTVSSVSPKFTIEYDDEFDNMTLHQWVELIFKPMLITAGFNQKQANQLVIDRGDMYGF